LARLPLRRTAASGRQRRDPCVEDLHVALVDDVGRDPWHLGDPVATAAENQRVGACFQQKQVSTRLPRLISCQSLVPTGKTRLAGSVVSIFDPGGNQIQRREVTPSSHIVAPGRYAWTSGASVRVGQSR
jgi:hypothetical protein